MDNEQLTPLLRLAEASLSSDDPIALAYDRSRQRACLVRWLPAHSDTVTLVAAIESLANQRAAWASVLAGQVTREPTRRVATSTSMGVGLLHRGLMNG